MSEAVPVQKWKCVEDEPVLIYVVHENSKYEKDEAKRLGDWEGWHVARWTDFNCGGWVWHGLCGIVTHVAKLPARPGHFPRTSP